MDELGLDEPKTLDDAFEIIEAFCGKRNGAEEGEDPVGLVCDTDLCRKYQLQLFGRAGV